MVLSREHAAIVIKLAGISAVVAKSFGRIFYRNAINVGLAAIVCDVEGIEEGDALELKVHEGVLLDRTKGLERRFNPLPAIMRVDPERRRADQLYSEAREAFTNVADRIQILYIQGDGVGADIWAASHEAFEEAVIKAYNGARRIEWMELTAGEKALAQEGELLPESTLTKIREHKVALKGPLTTPVGGGFRSINVYLRQIFDLYACVRPVRYFAGLPSPLKRPEQVNFVILRENTEDLYRGIEWEEGTHRGAQPYCLSQGAGERLVAR